jgi:hypothetical protein
LFTINVHDTVPTTNNQSQKAINCSKKLSKHTHTHDRYKQQDNLNNGKLKQQQASGLPFLANNSNMPTST